MYLNVKQRGDCVATFRWIEVNLMELLAGWVPTTPEMEVKLVMGAHIWDVAQHADSLGKRTHELRLPLQDSLSPSPAYVEFLSELADVSETNQRIAGFYDCILPSLKRRLTEYAGQVDPLLDGPTLRIIDRIIADGARMMEEGAALRKEIPALAVVDQDWLEALRKRESALHDVVAYRDAASQAHPVQTNG
jgi:hypothetical protein